MPPRSRSRQARSTRTPDPSRSPRATRTRSSNELTGLDSNPDNNDEEYNSTGGAENNDPDDAELGTTKLEYDESSRKSLIRLVREPDDDEELEDGEEEEEDEEDEEEEDADSSVKKEVKQAPKRRGRKRTKFVTSGEGFLDDEGNPISIVDDEVVIENEDPKGREKIDENGNLKGDREFRMKTFKLLGQGDRLYMVSTEPARLVGFRDSYLLFKTHRSLFKKVCTFEEKMDLIERHIIPNSYKGRSVNLVVARSIFREFGARVINQGKKVIDDFWEQRAIDKV